MKPIIEIRSLKHRAQFRPFIVCISPEHGKVIASKMIGSTLSREEIAIRVLGFTQWAVEWFANHQQTQPISIVSRISEILL